MTNFENSPYTRILNKEISSAELATIINKAMNKNADNKIEKDDKGYYLENDENSIKIDVHFLINDIINFAESSKLCPFALFASWANFCPI